MKYNDTGGLCIIYIEASDTRSALLTFMTQQKKPIALMLAEQSSLFQRPDDFSALKHLKSQLDLSVFFVAAESELSAQLAIRYGFPVYVSIESLTIALYEGPATV